jgi:twitching motility protein PilT
MENNTDVKTVTIRDLLITALNEGASDLQITVGVPPILKIKGELKEVGNQRLMPQDAERLVRELFTDEVKFMEYLNNGDRDFSISVPGVGRFRVNTFIQRGSLAAAIRVVHTELPDPESLLIPKAVLDLHKHNKGLILVTGPTGCGKSTTLSCLIDLINSTRRCHILTLEEPIEFLHKHKMSVVINGIGQEQKAMRRLCVQPERDPPDGILLGKCAIWRPSFAMTAAETRPSVLSTSIPWVPQKPSTVLWMPFRRTSSIRSACSCPPC